MLATSLVQMASHAVVQQYVSLWQMSDAHGSHDGSSWSPVVQMP
jgi:hypothetical protein